MTDITFIVAGIAGIISFLSPCVLPIIPGFLAYLSGTSLEKREGDEEGGGSRRGAMFANSLFFVLGFSVVFAALGVLLNTLLEAIAYDVQIWLARIGGAVIIFFGIYLSGLIRIPFLEREHKFRVTKKFNSRFLTSFVFGAAFAAGWTPCVGAALGAILGLAASAPGTAFWLLLSYAIGLGIPFLLVGLFASSADKLITKYSHILVYVNRGFGVVLIILGILVFTQDLSRIANFELLNKFLLK
ncbi:MAG: cytochrome C biogenesis protein [Parcubacteria group bacterium CG11_big_fil_rev_8_21_14_0_20_39_22]|nr:MAG: cytochrome C biogenesis protein [Parcubacteria group bacterium CG11_big_fil_rev_8_21_14_0_20_39_22]